MNGYFKINTIKLALCLAYPALALPALAAEPYPALPVTLSSSVAPNILLMIDTSGSMGNCPSAASGSGCTKKITSAKTVAKNLVASNPSLRWGLFSFDGTGTAGKLRADVGSTPETLKTKIDALTASGLTPLGEALYEASRYWAGETSAYSKNDGNNYASPMQYRCQKNFNIFISDGESTDDDKNLPGAKNCTYNGSGCNWSSTANKKVSYGTWSSSGVSSDLMFGICTNTTAINTHISCPAKLEGSLNTKDIFDDDYSPWLRSVRDVSAFLFDRDFKYKLASTDDTDKDGVSWDDPKFPNQNVITYTVGFDLVSSPSATGSDGPTVLGATAVAGGGKYYAADDEGTLALALSNAVNSIISSISNAGGVATQSETTSAGNKVFQPVFNPRGWYGALRCFDLDDKGDLKPGGCAPNAKGVIPPVASRKIFSSKVVLADTPDTTKFDFNDSAGYTAMTANQKSLLGVDAASQKNVINFIRGTEGLSGFRKRPDGLLGDIIDGQPVVVSAPSGMTSDTTYGTFKTANKDRNIVMIGANDGMMHAFGVGDMTELMAYIPSAVYPRLKALTATDYGLSAGTPHTFHVNGTMRQQDIKTDNAWNTLVVGGLGQGGQGFYAVNATDSTTLGTASGAVKWEWNDQNDVEMGYSFAAPVIYNVRTSEKTVVPAVILANGYENDYDDTAVYGKRKAEDPDTCKRVVTGLPNKLCNTSALYVINASTGELIKKISVPGTADGIGGLSSPAGVDFGQDGILDYVYAGDMSGKVWRFDLTDNNPANFKVVTTPIFDAGPTHPVVMRPAIKPVTRFDGVSIGNLVMFGTGKLLTDADRADKTTQTFYAVLDDMSASPKTASRTDLLERTILGTVAESRTGYRAGTYRIVSRDPSSTKFDLTSESNTWKGWRLDFPLETERLVTSPMLYDDKLLFGTGVTQSSQQCLPGGKGWVMGLDPMTGSVTKSARGKEFSFIDVKTDGKSTDSDKVSFSLSDPTASSAFVSGFSKDGIPTELTYVASSSRIVTIASGDTTLGDIGQVIALKEANFMAVYTGNAGSGVSKGNPMDRPASTGTGKLYSGRIGDDKVDKEDLTGPGAGIKVETSTWREIK